MKSVSEVIKDAREGRSFSKAHLAGLTKIKKDFIGYIEQGLWDELPEYPVVFGFVRSIAKALLLDEKAVLALLRRDYPPKPIKLNPKPDVEDKFIWTPKLTFILGVALILLVAAGYLGFQYYTFVAPPKLEVEKPTEGVIVDKLKINVTGKTGLGATVEVNNQPVVVEDDGDFETEIEISKDTKEIVIKSTSRSGKETTITRKVEVVFEK